MMQKLKNILVVSRMVKYDAKAIQIGASLARRYDAKLTIMHVIHDPFGIEGWNLPVPNLERDYQKLLRKTREQLDKIAEKERKAGATIEVMLKEGKATREIIKTIKEKKIDLLVMLAHEEGHIEHFLFGRSNHELIRQMPCSIMLVKKEPAAAPGPWDA
ncbi:MAG TPA: universal stress protein [Nitrospirota bacterium]|nr:universal stress protein [Nitrospirota bacterium]